MLFTSPVYLLLFLPLVVCGYYLLARRSARAATLWLAGASLAFYAWWRVAYVPLLLGSVLLNYVAGWCIGHARGRVQASALAAAVGANLTLLAYFKYADFFIGGVNAVTHAQWPMLAVVLPIGISFFTFTQIAFLVDTYRGKVSEYRFLHYVLFITYFPHLVAGPLLHHAEMMPQFARADAGRYRHANIAAGLSMLVIGLAKKVLIADRLAPLAASYFDGPPADTLLLAWGGVLAYAFQLYFDFSGYSDMAIGSSRLFGIKLPLNFDSPYKAANIIDFWRRWHMTLSRFLRDYLYFPLGGNRHGTARRYVNLLLTMLLGGLWHGAAWTFAVWGLLHGLYLVMNHAWQAFKARVGMKPQGGACARAGGVLVTFAAVCFAWVFFRAASFERALAICAGMLGLHGVSLPESLGVHLGALRLLLEAQGVTFYLGGATRFVQTFCWVAVAAAISFAMPNSQQIMERVGPAFDHVAVATAGKLQAMLRWQPSAAWACWLGVLALACLLSLGRPSEFLYFQF